MCHERLNAAQQAKGMTQAVRHLVHSRNGRYGILAPTAASVRLDVEGPDDVAPLLDFVGDELAEVCGRDDKRRAPQVGKPRLQLGVG